MILKINKNDDLVSVVEEIILSQDEKIVLYMPENSSLSQSIINFQILKRETETAGKTVTIVPSDPKTEELALEAGFEIEPAAAAAEPVYKAQAGKKETGVRLDDRTIREEIETAPVPKKRQISKEETIEGVHSNVSSPGEEIKIKIRPSSHSQPRQLSDIALGPLPSVKKRKEIKVEQISAAEEIEEILPPIAQKKQAKKTNTEDETNYKITAYWMKDRSEPQIAEESETKPSGSKKKKNLILAGSAAAFAIIIIYLGLFVFPQAEILITAKRMPQEYETNIALAKNIIIPALEADNYGIPSKFVRLEKITPPDAIFPATGKKQVESKAHGKIIIYNAYSSAPQTLVANTRFLTPDNKLFRLDKKIAIPSAKIVNSKIVPSSIEASVTADQTGPEYNINPTKFTIPGFKDTPRYQGFYAESKEKFEGGLKGEAIIVTEEDIVKNKETVAKLLEKNLKEEVISKIPDEYLLTEKLQNFKITAFETDVKPGDVKDKFRINMKAELATTYFTKSDLETIARHIIENKTENFNQFEIKSIDYEFGEGRLDDNGQFVSFPLRVKTNLAKKIDQQKIKDLIAGKNKGEIKNAILTLPEIDSAKLKLWPFWVLSAPKNADKIKVIID